MMVGIVVEIQEWPWFKVRMHMYTNMVIKDFLENQNKSPRGRVEAREGGGLGWGGGRGGEKKQTTIIEQQ